jgi:transcriptional regulator with XRE-family HTH domain
MRIAAGVVLRDLATRLHRDPSALSRFERGMVLPRDVDSLVAAYDLLAINAVHRLTAQGSPEAEGESPAAHLEALPPGPPETRVLAAVLAILLLFYIARCATRQLPAPIVS